MALVFKKRFVAWGLLGIVALFAVVATGWMMSLPPAPASATPAPISDEERAATIEALKPPRERPLIATIGINDATETNDYVVPYSILKRAGIADVMMLATGPGPVTLYPALKVEPDTTVAEFDLQHPEGADYVIVPAMSRNDDPVVMAWLKAQAAKGATIIGVCAGALVVAEAGLLDGKKATTHWYYLKGLRQRHPSIEYVADRRLVVDGKVVTTTGITAALPLSLTLIEAIAGPEKAADVAAELGVAWWDARHISGSFIFTRPFAMTVLGNSMARWIHEDLGLALTPGMDEVTLAMVADAWSRTYRSRALTYATDSGALTTLSGLRIVPDKVGAAPDGHTVAAYETLKPVEALNQTLADITKRYGADTTSVVAMQLEYWGGAP